MARKKPAKSAKKKAAKPAARKAAKKTMKKKPAARASARRTPKKKAAKKASPPARKTAASSSRAKAGKAKKAPARRTAKASAPVTKKPNLDRPRKTVADIHGIPSSLDTNRSASAARTGRQELRERLTKNTSASPALTSGDVDADWESAETVGDEAPGGDNPTPDQDVVDEIGRALGVEYEDDEELQGGAEIADRDRNRWELDPASRDIDEDDE